MTQKLLISYIVCIPSHKFADYSDNIADVIGEEFILNLSLQNRFTMENMGMGTLEYKFQWFQF